MDLTGTLVFVVIGLLITVLAQVLSNAALARSILESAHHSQMLLARMTDRALAACDLSLEARRLEAEEKTERPQAREPEPAAHDAQARDEIRVFDDPPDHLS